MRSLAELDQLRPDQWTSEEAYEHLRHTFDIACRQFPDIMEPWIIRADGIDDWREHQEIMREALRRTISERWPLASEYPPGYEPKAA